MHLRMIAAVAALAWVTAPLRAEEPAKLFSESIKHNDRIWAIAFSPDGKLLAVGGGGGIVRPEAKKDPLGELTVWDVKSGKKVATLEGHRKPVQCVAWSPDGLTLASGAEDKTVRLWDVATWKETVLLKEATAGVRQLAFSPDGKTIATSAWDVLGGPKPPDWATPGTVVLWDVATRKVRSKLEGHPGPVWHITFSPDGKTLATSSHKWDQMKEEWVSGEIRLWSPTTAKLKATLDLKQGYVTALVFSPDGKMLATGSPPDELGDGKSRGGVVKLWDVGTRLLRGTAEVSGSSVDALAYSADGKLLATQGLRLDKVERRPFGQSYHWQSEVHLLDGQSLKKIAVLPDAQGYAGVLAFSPKGVLLATGEMDRVKLWQITLPP